MATSDRVPIHIRPETREKLRNLLLTPEFHGVGYSDFIERAIEHEENIQRGRLAIKILEEVADLTTGGMSVVDACKVVKERHGALS